MSAALTENPWLHRYAVFLAACTALLFVNGPAVSSNDARPLYSLGQTHIWLGAAVIVLTAGMAVWVWRREEREWLRRLVWVALGANIAEGLLGVVTDPQPAPVRISHSLLGQIIFSITVAIAVFTSKAAAPTPEPVKNAGLLRFVAATTPALVFSQVALGVVFRHGAIGAVPHILWACVVALYLVLVAAAIFNAEHAEIRRAGAAFAAVAGVQILIGFALFIMQSLDIDPAVLIVVTSVHATAGAITLAASVVLAIVIRRIVPAVADLT